jgi:hypothetical protein
MLRLLRLPRRLRSGSERERGQALPLFALMIFVITGSVAIVTDVSWFWVNNQRMQRAADAASLAGAVYLPGDVPGAYSAARASAAQNGYTNGVGGVLVTPVQDPGNRRRLNVTVSGPVSTYFARVFGLNTIQESALSKAEFTLPVPMGSPQVYYGLGTFLKTINTSTTASVNGDSGWRTASTVPSTVWTTPLNANGTSDTNYAVSPVTNGTSQQWSGLGIFGQLPVPTGSQTLTITGLELELRHLLTGSGNSTTCQTQAALSWDNGTTWSTTQNVTTTTLKVLKTFGTAASTASWGAHVWIAADFNNFRVRLTFNKPDFNCGASRILDIDTMRVRASYSLATTTVTTTVSGPQTINDPNGSALTSQGFWGAVITLGGSRENGDEFSPANDNLKGTSNPEYDAGGYDYTVILGSNGKLELFDPTFCETGSNASGGNLGAGDHWIGGPPNGVTTVFSLWNENGTAYTTVDDTQVATSGATFANQIGSDQSGNMGNPGHRTNTTPAVPDCSADPYHNAWYTMPGATGLAAGRYRLNVVTSAPGNASTNAENMWSAWVSSGGSPQVYGEGKMAAYNNLTAGTQLFYLAQIDRENAGKTMEITLFDPGDVSGDAYLRILSPNGNAYNYATFSYIADNGLTGTNVNVIQTASVAGGSRFQDAAIVIDVPLPTGYGSSGLTPPGESSAGWWKIEYQVNGGNDTTTWQVAIRGSPVHLVR